MVKSPLPGLPDRTPALSAVDAELVEASARVAQSDLAGAERCYRRVLTVQPDNIAALNGLGNVAVFALRFDEAISFHNRALALMPGDPGLTNDLANAYILAGQPEAAVPLLRRAIKAEPRMLPALLNLARAYRELGSADKALALLDKISKPTQPDQPTGEVGIDLERALALSQLGRVRPARALFRAVLARHPTNSTAIEGLATCHKATADDNDLAAIEAALAAPYLTTLQRGAAQRAAGKMLEDIGHYDEAFERFRLANASCPVTFDIEAHEAFIDNSIALFTPEFFASRAGFGDQSRQPVFVVGMPRSGTTLIEQILASHPRAAGLGELTHIELLLRRTCPEPFGSREFFDCLEAVPARAVGSAAKAYLQAVRARAEHARRTVDKMPHNFLVLGWIALLFPQARIIHCVRDPIDTCTSLYTHHFSEAHAYSNDLGVLGRYYRSYERLMQHWHSALPGMVLDVHYEQLVDDLERVTREMIAHIGLDWHARCLEFHRVERTVQTPSQWQVRQPIYTTSVQRWRRFENHLSPLFASLGAGRRLP